MKKYLLFIFLLTGCIENDDVYQTPETRETYIKSLEGYKTLVIAGSDTIVTSQPIKVKYVKD